MGKLEKIILTIAAAGMLIGCIGDEEKIRKPYTPDHVEEAKREEEFIGPKEYKPRSEIADEYPKLKEYIKD